MVLDGRLRYTQKNTVTTNVKNLLPNDTYLIVNDTSYNRAVPNEPVLGANVDNTFGKPTRAAHVRVCRKKKHLLIL